MCRRWLAPVHGVRVDGFLKEDSLCPVTVKLFYLPSSRWDFLSWERGRGIWGFAEPSFFWCRYTAAEARATADPVSLACHSRNLVNRSGSLAVAQRRRVFLPKARLTQTTSHGVCCLFLVSALRPVAVQREQHAVLAGVSPSPRVLRRDSRLPEGTDGTGSNAAVGCSSLPRVRPVDSALRPPPVTAAVFTSPPAHERCRGEGSPRGRRPCLSPAKKGGSRGT